MTTVESLNPVGQTEPPRAGRKEWWGLGVLALPLLLVSMDVSVLYFAIPFIGHSLNPSATQQLWILDVYGFVLAGLLLTMGSLGDLIGRRKLLLIGAAGFSAASIFAAYSQNAAMLIAARAVLGLAGSTLMPSSLALLRNMFHDAGQRAKAIAIWTAVLSGGVALGPVLSGILLEHFWWGSVFLINVPAMVLLMIVGPILLPEFRTARSGRGFDVLSAGLSLATVVPLIYGIKEWAADGFRVGYLVAVVAGVVMGALFVARQLRAEHPMLDKRLFASRGFSGGVITNAIGMFGLVGNAVFTTQYLQSVLGMSPLVAALWSLVPSLAVGAAAPLATALGAKLDKAYVMAGGFVIAALGFGLLTRITPDSSILLVLVGAGGLAVGIVAVLTLVTELAVGSVEPDRAGAASAVLETGSEFGGALGIAVLGTIGAAVYRSHMHVPATVPAALATPADQTMAGALEVSTQLPSATAGNLVHAATTAFTDGMSVAAGVGAIIMLVAAAVCLAAMRKLTIH
jgi:MFS transporter, DHA2 family, multidrug resistance protein